MWFLSDTLQFSGVDGVGIDVKTTGNTLCQWRYGRQTIKNSLGQFIADCSEKLT
jgi:hypothetical protein